MACTPAEIAAGIEEIVCCARRCFGRFRRLISWLVLGGALTALSPVRTVAQTCPGDCSGDMRVSVDEIIRGVTIDLGLADVSACPVMDTNHDLEVKVDELVTAVANALNGCPTSTPTPTLSPTATSAPTATPTATMGTGNLPPTAVDDAAASLSRSLSSCWRMTPTRTMTR